MAKGRKKKQTINLFNHEDELRNSQYVDYANKSIKNEILTWEYKNVEHNSTEVFVYPLSYESAIKHFKSEIKLGINKQAISILSRIKNKTHDLDEKRQIFTKYPEYKVIINQLLYETSNLCCINNAAKRTGSSYASALAILVEFIITNFPLVKSVEEFDDYMQESLYNELCSSDSIFYSSILTAVKTIMLQALKRVEIHSQTLSKQLIRKQSHSGKNTRIDYSQEVAVQLLASSIKQINVIKKQRKEYLLWKKNYLNKPFDSIENLARAYLTIPISFIKKTESARVSSIIKYQKFYDDLCMEIYAYRLMALDDKTILDLSSKGTNIDDLDDPYIMAWFMDDICINYPFNIEDGSYVSTVDKNLSEYTRWNKNVTLKTYLTDRGKRRGNDFVNISKKIVSRKIPNLEEVTPFLLFWMLQTGCNPEALINMQRKRKNQFGFEKIGELSPIKDSTIIKSFKNRGTKNWYWFVLNIHEKNGLYDHFLFLKQYFKILWKVDDIFNNKTNKWSFWVYYSAFQTNKVVSLSWSALQHSLNKYIKENSIIEQDGSLLEHIDASRLRNTFITMADLGKSSMEEIQEWIRHKEFDTRFMYYGNSSDQRSRNFRAINAIQESIMEEARVFKGIINYGVYSNELKDKNTSATILCECNDNENPAYNGAKTLRSNHVCIDWDKCLGCENSRVYKEHLPRICLRIIQYKEYRKTMLVDEWENNFGSKHAISKDTLIKWVADGGEETDIDEAWEIAKSGTIKIPPIFPAGSIKKQEGDNSAA